MERAGRLIGKLKLSSVLAEPEARARAAWKVAAGEKIARHTRPTVLVRGSLIVEVEDYIWQKQLSTLRAVLIRNMAKVLGEELVIDLDFRPMPPRRLPQRAETPRRMTEGIKDPVLEMLYRQSQKKELA
ncbi:MAG: DciA family protein [Bryobacteraceae bacterium]|jgi:predicted nucleic acid-binding Zn ribbon protein